jgi:uncharacterized protein (TIGR03086 family)
MSAHAGDPSAEAMNTTLSEALALLDRALGYTRGTIAGVRTEHLRCPTPCTGWRLDQLLVHMDDALDAFHEAWFGRVLPTPDQHPGDLVASVRSKACSLLGRWITAPPQTVALADRLLQPTHVLGAAALEITVHGWDVAQSTGANTPVPVELAQDLLGVAHHLVAPSDRPRRFGPARAVSTSAPSDQRLLAFLGRRSGPPGPDPDDSPTREADPS